MPSDLKPPRHLSQAAKTIWNQFAPHVWQLGLLTVIDTEGFGRWCEIVASNRRLTKAIARDGEMVKETVHDSNGQAVVKLKPNPRLAVLRAGEKEQRQIGGLYGLDPTSRTRLDVMAAGGGPPDGYEAERLRIAAKRKQAGA